MSSTTGVKSGNLLNEIGRPRPLLQRKQRRLRAVEESRDMWRERARAAEWANRKKAA